MTTKKRRTCLVCGKRVEADGHCVSGAVIFRSHGNYGSTVFDLDGFELLAFVHDACLVKRVRSTVAVFKRQPPPEFEYVGARYSKRKGLHADRRIRK